MSTESPVWKESVHNCEDGVYRIELNRPDQMNAFTPTLYRELKHALLIAGAEADVRVVVIEGRGDNFSAGGDLKTLLDILARPESEQISAFTEAFDETMPFQVMLDLPKPIIAKVDGLCLAGGLILASLADATIASERARFGVPESRVGLVDTFCPAVLPRVVGLSRARYMMMSGALIDADRAADWGLITEVVTTANLEQRVQEVIGEFKKASPDAQRLYKQLANREIPRLKSTVVMEAALTDNGHEGLYAFRDKRKPAWGPNSLPL